MAFSVPVVSFSAKANGDTFGASEINQLRASINAMVTLHNTPDVFDIRRFVSGLGATVTQSAFVSALDAMPTAGGKIRLPAGITAKLTDTVQLTKPVHLEGDGKGDLYHRNVQTNVQVDGAFDAFKVVRPATRFSGFRITGLPPMTNQTAFDAAGSRGIFIDIREAVPFLAQYTTEPLPGTYALDYMSFYNLHSSVWQLNGLEGQASYCDFIKYRRYGLYLENLNLPDGGDMSVVGCNFYPESINALSGAHQVSGGGAKFVSCKWNARAGGNADYAFTSAYQGNTVDLIFSACSIENTLLGGIKSRGNFHKIQVVGTQFTLGAPGAQSCVDIQNVGSVVVQGNIFDDPMSNAVQLDGCQDVLVSHNQYANIIPGVRITNSKYVRNTDTVDGRDVRFSNAPESTFNENFPANIGVRFVDHSEGGSSSIQNNGLTLTVNGGKLKDVARARTAGWYDVRGRSVVARITQVLPANGESNTSLTVGHVYHKSADTIRMTVQSGVLYAQYGDGHATFGQVTYNQATMQYWRIQVSADGQTFTCAYSADGGNWTTLLTRATEFVDVARAYVTITGAYASGGATPTITVPSVTLS